MTCYNIIWTTSNLLNLEHLGRLSASGQQDLPKGELASCQTDCGEELKGKVGRRSDT